ncbi:MAG: DipZ protein [Solirubrobacterales bacterium]|nr:DipZ protein [Solirubrobacterales bacterium]
MRAPPQAIHAPHFPRDLRWANVATLRLDQQRGRPILVEFFDPLRVHSLRTLPYIRAWHDRYDGDGLRVVSVLAPGFAPARDETVARAAVLRLGIEHAVALDLDFRLWQLYGNRGWPARYLWDQGLLLHEYHLGQGGYLETEEAIQELLGVQREPLAPVRVEDAPDARLAAPSPDEDGPWSGAYEAGGVWSVLEGAGEVTANGRTVAVDGAACYPLVLHERHTAAQLELWVGPGVTCHAVQFEPGLVD